ncbi:uncharacterized protein KY384_009240 [Bacidia gigantensis]|uniref:uncharacterized protein n=1 Tax=Bacidia gigantensis TaxID=2732470 RepID=UPI001D052D6E|nr:uncharacterized protein KY384_009240 [Bacidia gigantensis]KAG8525596.1 hypothetical protein KY384_009240 [Bacidia gigantensis]
MAEAAGLAIGAIGLAVLFTTCVEGLEYINLGRNHGRDFEMSMTKLLLLKARLSAWGEVLQVTQEGEENIMLRDRWLEEKETVGRCLVGVQSMFDESDQMESRYGLKRESSDQPSSSLQEQRSKAFQQIEDKFNSVVRRRQESVSIPKKTRWAIHDKKKFDSLIADLAFFIDGLEDLGDRLQMLSLQQRLVELEVQEITDTESMSLMEDASTQIQALPSPQIAVKERSQGGIPGHTYVDTIIKDRAKVLNANVGLQSQSSHSYHGTQAYDDAQVVQGDVSNEVALAFFR